MTRADRARLPRLAPLLLAIWSACAASSSAAPPASTSPAGGPSQLAELLERASQDSPALARARAQLEAAAARSDAAAAEARPHLQLQERIATTTDPPSAFMSVLQQQRLTPEVQARLNDPERTDDWATSIGLRWLAFDFGRRRAARDSAESEQARFAHLEAAALRDVRFEVTTGWLDLARAVARVELWSSSLEVIGRHADVARARFEEGAALRSEPLALAVLRDETRESLLAAEREVLVARARLAMAVGCSVDEIGPDPATIPSSRPPPGVEILVERARSAHPLSLAAGEAIASASARERHARRLRRPALGLDVRHEWHGDDEAPGLDNPSWSAAVVADWTISDFGRSAAARREAAAWRLDAEAAHRELVSALELGARVAHAEAMEASARVAIADEAVASASSALDIIEARWTEGLAPVLDLLDARRSLTDARVRAVDARARALAALAQVERVAGELPEGEAP